MVRAVIRRAVGYLAFVLVTALLVAGCNGQRERHERDLQALREEIAELRRARADQQERIVELRGRLDAVEDGVETLRFSERRREQVPDLPVFSMEPEAYVPASPLPDASPQVPAIRMGPGPPTQGAPPQTLPPDVLARADHRGIEAEERLEVAPVPPVPKKRRTAGSKKKKVRKKADKPPAAGDEVPRQRYRQAHETLKGGDVAEARRLFREFVTEFPQHELADNAQYWVGECYYDQRDYETAVRAFRHVIESYPTGNKVPDALLKIGLAYLSLGDRSSAREVLAKVVEIFPESNAARIALERSKVL